MELMNLYKHKIIVEYEGTKYRLGWVNEWKDDLVTIGSNVIDGRSALGTPCQILFGRMKEKKLEIVGTWGKGNLYLRYLIDFQDRFT